MPFDATFVDLFAGELEIVESNQCAAAEHCAILATACDGTPLVAVAPVDTGTKDAQVMYKVTVDQGAGTATITVDSLIKHTRCREC